MSTSYYRLREPVTSLRIERNETHARLSIWTNHGLAGTLVLRGDELAPLLCALSLDQDDFTCPLRTHWGGKDRGSVVTVNDPSLPDDVNVISEYGVLLTVGEVKARDGAKRSDGYPTELFGYEP